MKKQTTTELITIIIILFCCIYSNKTYSQLEGNGLVFTYSFQRNNYESKYILKFNDDYSIWEEINDLMPKTDANVNFMRSRKYHRRKVYKSISDSLMISNYDIMAEKFYIKEQMGDLNWQISDSTTVVLGKKCNLAKVKFRGRNYDVFYTPDITTSNGPWKFHGLPGLILKVVSKENEEYYKIECIEINKTSSKEDLSEVYKKYLSKKRRKFLSWNDFSKNVNLFINNVIKYHKSNYNYDEDEEGKSGFRLLNYLEIFHDSQKGTVWY